MNERHYEALERAGKAVVRRISAENTWLRHSHTEMEQRVSALAVEIAAIKREARALIKTLKAAATAAKPKQTTRSKT
jgi:hypothetical protein